MARREQAAIDATIRAYQAAIDAAEARIARLAADLERLPASSWRTYAIRERESVVRELQQLLNDAASLSSRSIDTQRAIAAAEAASTTSTAVAGALQEAGRDVLAGAIGGVVNDSSLRAMMAQVYGTSPVTDMLTRYAAQGAQAAGDRLVRAIALGENPRKISAALRRDLGTEAWKALRIARTEVIRAHTAGQLAVMRATPTITPAYEWACRTATACVACLAQHGTVSSIDQPPARHPNCRCVMLPVVIDPTTGQALSQPTQTGQDVIDAMSLREATDRFGARRAALLKAPDANRVPVTGMVTTRTSDQWGRTVGVTTLKDLATA